MLTVAHLAGLIARLNTEVTQYQENEKARAKIDNDDSINRQQKKLQLKKLPKPKKTTNISYSVLWGQDSSNIPNLNYDIAADLAAGQLENFDPGRVKTYPKIKDPKKDMLPGTSLCKLGYPFHNIRPTWDDAQSGFQLPKGSWPPPPFPMEGIFTRLAMMQMPNPNDPNNPYSRLFLETSTPGLRGQSGGPIFDSQGNIWAVQSHTEHIPLGFDAVPPGSRKGNKVHQFLNVGRGAHSETIIGFLRDNGIKFGLSEN